MPDLRERVEEDRGLLKRIQVHIPGFAGYRRREDLRDADAMLRIQIANKLKELQDALGKTRAAFTANYLLKPLEPLGALILSTQSLEGQIRHAETGYSGLVADIKIHEPQMNKLYEWDASMLDGVADLQRMAAQLAADAASEPDKAIAGVQAMQSALDEMEATFKRRMNVITGTEV